MQYLAAIESEFTEKKTKSVLSFMDKLTNIEHFLLCHYKKMAITKVCLRLAFSRIFISKNIPKWKLEQNDDVWMNISKWEMVDSWLVASNAFFKLKKPKSLDFETILVSKGERRCFCV